MKTMWNNSAFSRFDLASHALSGPGTTRPSMGALADYIDRIQKVADSKTRDALQKKWTECEAKGVDSIEGLACLAALGLEIDRILKTQPATPVVPPPAPASSFPIIPVAIGSVAAIGLILLLVRKGK